MHRASFKKNTQCFVVGMDSLTLSYQQMVSCLFNTTL